MFDSITAVAAAMLPLADNHWDGPGAWILLVPLFWGLVILGIVWIVRGSRPWGPRASFRRPESGIEVLERRFAAGEIDHEEYRQRRSTLEEHRH
jgi:putative membrane protein